MMLSAAKLSVAILLLPGWLVDGAIGIDGKPLSGSFDPTKCKLDRSDDLFKEGQYGGQCAKCVTNDQCRDAYGSSRWYCCPFMKRCVNSGSMGCYDTAFCRPRCFGEQYPALKAECSGCDSKFPDNWVKGCTASDWADLVGGPVHGESEDQAVVVNQSDSESEEGDSLKPNRGDGSGMQVDVIPESSLGGRTSSDPENVRDASDKCWEVTEAPNSKYNGIYVPCSIAVVKKFFPRYDNYRCWNKRFHDKGEDTAYPDPVMVFSWKWFMPAAFPVYESFNKQEPVDWVVSQKWGSGSRVPTVTEVSCADVDYGYVCENSGCSTSGLTEGRDYGFYSEDDGDCEACVAHCTEDSARCGSVECGESVGHCMWWKRGQCEDGYTKSFTCRRYNNVEAGGVGVVESESSSSEEPVQVVEESSSEDESVPVSVPAPVPTPNEEMESEVEHNGPCEKIGADGQTCKATPGCVWDWDLYSCVGNGEVVEEERNPCDSLKGPECVASAECTWDWDNGCVSFEAEPCQKLGDDGPACLSTHGCEWDWSTFTCSAAKKSAPKNDGNNNLDGGCAGANSAKACRKLAGCTFDKKTKVCLTASASIKDGSDSDEGVADKCKGLPKPKCRKTDGCVLNGKKCEVESGKGDKNDVGNDNVCAGLKRSVCEITAGCKFNKKQKSCLQN